MIETLYNLIELAIHLNRRLRRLRHHHRLL